MDERYEAEVTAIIGVGPHPTRPGLYQIQVHVAPAAPSEQVTLLLPQAQAISLARMLQDNPPRAAMHDHVLDDIAGIDT